ncbi:hypothetical protein BDAP_001867 [Binucleata daphniae]
MTKCFILLVFAFEVHRSYSLTYEQDKDDIIKTQNIICDNLGTLENKTYDLTDILLDVWQIESEIDIKMQYAYKLEKRYNEEKSKGLICKDIIRKLRMKLKLETIKSAYENTRKAVRKHKVDNTFDSKRIENEICKSQINTKNKATKHYKKQKKSKNLSNKENGSNNTLMLSFISNFGSNNDTNAQEWIGTTNTPKNSENLYTKKQTYDNNKLYQIEKEKNNVWTKVQKTKAEKMLDKLYNKYKDCALQFGRVELEKMKSKLEDKKININKIIKNAKKLNFDELKQGNSELLDSIVKNKFESMQTKDVIDFVCNIHKDELCQNNNDTTNMYPAKSKRPRNKCNDDIITMDNAEQDCSSQNEGETKCLLTKPIDLNNILNYCKIKDIKLYTKWEEKKQQLDTLLDEFVTLCEECQKLLNKI